MKKLLLTITLSSIVIFGGSVIANAEGENATCPNGNIPKVTCENKGNCKELYKGKRECKRERIEGKQRGENKGKGEGKQRGEKKCQRNKECNKVEKAS